ncbi:type IV pilus assembly protein PilW [Delftia acidovorans]|uniref:PilW family protein n=1 Tax=Delftia acidovorans TaxID=80866 RepID=UPI000F4D1146|nr:PilW family protein [Delftia acidovorans]ROR04151.1 type IV pilus assembly protein PilW [Delftia acidovorans]
MHSLRYNSSRAKHPQQGLSLLELMVGITIGLLTIAVALGALMATRGISGTVSEASQMQQQAAYAFRVIGMQLRQAGSVELNLAYGRSRTDQATNLPQPMEPVVFEANVDRASKTLAGVDSPGSSEFKLSTGYMNYQELNYGSDTAASFFRNCLGEGASDTLITSRFALRSGELVCNGGGTNTQPLISNVSDFRVTYLVQDNTGSNAASPSMSFKTATEVGDANWSKVFGVQVCLELTGTEKIDTVGSKYTNCAGTATDRGNKLRMVFRNTYQIRSQGKPA